ncbi:hypothetical protein CRYUN_Cryun07bG0064600 [Craigia yunnanensis]
MGDFTYLSLAVALALGVWLVLNGDEVAADAAGRVMGSSISFVQMRRKTLANGLAQTPPMR